MSHTVGAHSLSSLINFFKIDQPDCMSFACPVTASPFCLGSCLFQAVCCSDFVHCCPHGKKCNLAAQTCDDPSGSPSEPWLKKVPAVPREGKLPGDVTCDPTYMCPDNTTCCKTASGDWACCPLPEVGTERCGYYCCG